MVARRSRSDQSAVSPLVVVVGETAAGKSALALELAGQLDGELICADSWTVYKDFDIGTAKPSAEERARVPHHLLDVADPRQGFSAVEFQRLARQAIDDISGRGRLPIMVGGTGLYVDSVLLDYQFLPAPAAGLRRELEALSLAALLDRAAANGYDTAGIDTRNKRRIIRLIENQGRRPDRGELRPNSLVLGIRTDREHLRQRVERRVDAMLAAGLEQEVRRLAAEYGWEAEPMKGIGYREWRPYVESGVRQAGAGEPRSGSAQDLEQTRQRIIAATMNLAKRQRTWFQRHNWIQWIEWMEEPENSSKEDLPLLQ